MGFTRHIAKRDSALVCSLLLVLVGISVAHAANYTWQTDTGGTFSDAANWLPSGGPPGAGDGAYFNLDTTYQVDFTGNATTDQAYFTAGTGATVTLNLAGFQWSNTNGRVYIAEGLSNNNLVVQGGTLNAIYHCFIGAVGGTDNSVSVSGPAAILNTTNYDIGIGYTTEGSSSGDRNTMTVSGGGAVSAGRYLYIGGNTGADNTLTVTGAGSSISAGSLLGVYGSGGGNTLTLQNGATASGRGGLGDAGNSVLVDNATWTLATEFKSSGTDNTVTVQGGGTLSGPANVTIGTGGTGNSLTITNGTVSGSHIILGNSGGSGNTILVTGASSLLTTSNFDFGIGNYSGYDTGTGDGNTLTVSAGGKVTPTRNLYIGSGSATGNQATVTGTGSQITAQTVSIRGTGGSNSLSILDNATVTAQGVLGGDDNSVSINGGSWTTTGNWQSQDTNNALTISGGGSLTTGVFRVGEGSGSSGNAATITNGTVTTSHVVIGGSVGTGNAVLVTGASSLLQTTNFDITLGAYGGGASTGSNNTLTVANGGTVSCARHVFIGTTDTTDNQVTVGGTGSTLSSQLLTINGSGGGNNLTVQTGGTVTQSNTVTFAGTTNTATVSGGTWNAGSFTSTATGSTLDIVNGGLVDVGGMAYGGTNNAMTINGGTLDVAGHFTIGVNGSGNDVVVTGATGKAFTGSYDVQVGYHRDSGQSGDNNTMTVSGGANLTANRSIFVGGGAGTGNELIATGTGTTVLVNGTPNDPGINLGGSNALLRIADGASLNNYNYSYFTGSNNRMELDGGTWTTRTIYFQGTGNTMVVDNGGALNTDGLVFNSAGSNGTLDIQNGTVTVLGHVYLGEGGGTNNLLQVSGSSSQLSITNYDMNFGSNGNDNTLRVADGGTVIVPRNTFLGRYSTSGNQLIVTGAGSTYQTGNNIYGDALNVGSDTAGNNTVTVDSGAVLDTLDIIVGTAAGNSVTNTGGTYQFRENTPTITVGSGTISLTGGTISFRDVTGANVHANTTANLANIDYAGDNTFMLNNASTTTGTNQTYTFDSVANTSDPTNYQKLAMTNDTTAYRNGDVTVASGGAMEVTNTSASMTGSLANAGALSVDAASTLTVAGTVTQSAGTTTVQGTISSPNTMAFSGGTLTGSGILDAPLVTITGNTMVIPGQSPGRMTIDGNLQVGTGSTLAIELFGMPAGDFYDQLYVTGSVILDPGVILDLTIASPARRFDTYTVIEGASLSGSLIYNGITLNDGDLLNVDGWILQAAYDALAGDFMLTVLVPEPASAMLLALAGLAFIRRHATR